MNRRFRSLIALIALFGFVALFAENLMAMACGTSDAAPQTAAVMSTHDGGHHPAPTSPDPESDTGAPQHCPLPMAGTPCAAPATLPAAQAASRAPALVAESALLDVADSAHTLIIRALFHPPKS